MADYKKLYFKMAAEAANAVDRLAEVAASIIRVQQECEDIYINSEDSQVIKLMDKPENQKS